MTQETDEFSRIIRQRHHLAVARLWLTHATIAALFGVPLWAIGVIVRDGALEFTGAALCAASWACSQACGRHSKAARRAGDQ